MSLITLSAVRARARKSVRQNFSSVNALLEGKMVKQASVVLHDIFLSHAFDDKEVILGVALTLEDLGFSVYLDWRDDPGLDRTNVNVATAAKLRERMRNSKCLFYATTQHSSSSRWMPWELGFKDGQNNRCAILPVQETVPIKFNGTEYLALYPYITQQKDADDKERLWVRHSEQRYVLFEAWLSGYEPREH